MYLAGKHELFHRPAVISEGSYTPTAAKFLGGPMRPQVPNSPLVDHKVAGNSPVYSHGCKSPPFVAEGVAGKPGLFAGGRKLYFRYSSQGG